MKLCVWCLHFTTKLRKLVYTLSRPRGTASVHVAVSIEMEYKPLHPMSGLIGAEMQMPGCIGAAAVSKALHSDESQLIIWKYLVRSIIPFGPKGPGHTGAEGPSGPRRKFRYSIKASKYTETYAVVLLRDFTKSFENNWSAATFQSNPQKPLLQ